MLGDMVRFMLPGLLILACWVLLILYWNISARSSKPAAERQSLAGRLAEPQLVSVASVPLPAVLRFMPTLQHRCRSSDRCVARTLTLEHMFAKTQTRSRLELGLLLTSKKREVPWRDSIGFFVPVYPACTSDGRFERLWRFHSFS